MVKLFKRIKVKINSIGFIGLLKLFIENRIIFIGKPPKKQSVLFDEIKSLVRKLPSLQIENSSTPAEFWDLQRKRLRELMLTEDLRTFLTWDVIRATIFSFSKDYNLELLEINIKQNRRIANAIKESKIGLPKRHPLCRSTSCSLVRHGYGIDLFEKKGGIPIEHHDFIFEFGGGYGGMCRTIHRLGFKGPYYIFDFPELNILQYYYLKSNELPVNTPGIVHDLNGIYLISKTESLSGLFKKTNGLFIANWSISETPIEFRDDFFKLPVFKSISSYFISFQNKHLTLNNPSYFSRFQKERNPLRWEQLQIKTQPGSNYLFGIPNR